MLLLAAASASKNICFYLEMSLDTSFVVSDEHI